MPAKKEKNKKKCPICGNEKNAVNGFYKSASPLFADDGCVPICSMCVKDGIVNDDGTINQKKFKTMMQRLDKPMYWDDLESSYAQYRKEHGYLSDDEVARAGREIIGIYFKNTMLRQNRNKSFADSESDGFVHSNSNTVKAEKDRIIKKYMNSTISDIYDSDIDNSTNKLVEQKKKKEKPVIINDEYFEVTAEMIDLFGDGYLPSIYKKMMDKYDKLKLNYTLQTNIHQEALATYVRFKVHEEIATSQGKIEDAKKWYDAAQKSAQDAKLTPKQLTKADLDSGVNSISEMVKAVEQAVDVIKILPRFKYRPTDAPDFNIWCYVNYERNISDMPIVDYDDIYKFYDERKEEYIKQNGDPYGIFKDDTAQRNRENVKMFIQLPDDYDELAGEENG